VCRTLGGRRIHLAILSLTVLTSAFSLRARLAWCAPTAGVSKAEYLVTSPGSAGARADVSLRMEVASHADGWQAVCLFAEPVALRAFRVAGRRAELERRGDSLWLHLHGRGTTAVTLEYSVGVSRRGAERSIELPLVPATAARVIFRTARGEYTVHVAPDAPLEVKAGEGRTGAVIIPRGGDRLRISWLPRELEREREALFDAEEAARAMLCAGAAVRESRIRIRIKQGALAALALDVPPGVDVLSVRAWRPLGPRGILSSAPREPADPAGRAPVLAGWRLEGEDGARVLHVTLRAPVGDALDLVIASEQVAERPPLISLRPFRVRGAGRCNGRIDVSVTRDLAVAEVGSSGARRAAAGEGAALAFEYHNLPAEVTLRWDAVPPRLSARLENHVRLRAGLADLTCRVALRIEGAPVRDLELTLEEGVAVLDVSGEDIETWNAGERRLHVRLSRPRSGDYVLEVRGAQPLRRVNGIRVPILAYPAAGQVSGCVGISAGDGVTLTHGRARKLVQVDAAQLPEWIRARRPKLAYLFDRPGPELIVSTTALRPALRVEATAAAVIGDDAVQEEYVLDCVVKRRPLFAITIELPEGLIPLNLLGEAVADWEFVPDSRIIRVALREGVLGRTGLHLFCERRYAAEAVTLGGVNVVEAEDIVGRLGVATVANLDLRPEAEAGVVPDDVGRLPASLRNQPGLRLAYRWRGPNWSVRIRLIPISPRMTAETRTALLFGSSLLRVRTDITWTIASASVAALEVALPEGALRVQLAGENIRTYEPQDALLRLHLAAPVRGTYSAAVTYELLPDAGGTVIFEGVHLPGVERQRGVVAAYCSDPQMEVVVEDLVNLSRTGGSPVRPLGEFPFIGGFEYDGPERRIRFRLKGHALAEGVRLSARRASMTTVVKPEGEAITRLVCRLENAGRQFFRMRLPEHAELWTASVEGEPVRPSRGGPGEVLLPLLDAPRGRPFTVEAVWIEPVQRIGYGAAVGLLSPELDVPAEHVDWQVRLPDDYDVVRAGGNMKLLQRDLWRRQGFPAVIVRAYGIVARAFRSLAPWLIGVGVTIGFAALLFQVIRVLLWWRKRRSGIGPRPGLLWRPVAYLITAAMVMVLAGLLMPALSRAREESRRMSPAGPLRLREPPAEQATPRSVLSPQARRQAEELFDLAVDKGAQADALARQERHDRAMQLARSYARRGKLKEAEEQLMLAAGERPESDEAKAVLGRLRDMPEVGREGAVGPGAPMPSEPPGAKPQARSTARIALAAIRALHQELHDAGLADRESAAVESDRERVILDLATGARKAAELGGAVLRAEEGSLVVSGSHVDVEAWRAAAARLRNAMLKLSRSATEARKQAETEVEARRRAELRRRVAQQAIEGGRRGGGTVAGSRAAGARALSFEALPVLGTRAYDFRTPYAGMSRARIEFVCLRSGVAVVAQAAILFITAASATALCLRRPLTYLVALVVATVALAFIVSVADAASKGYVAMALAGIVFAVAATAVSRLRRRMVR